MRSSRIIAVVSTAIAVAGCGGGGGSDSSYSPTSPAGPTTNPVTTNQVSIASTTFAPGTVSIPVGTTVTWTWNDCPGGASGGYGVCVSHNVTFDDGSNIGSATQDNGTFARTFNTAGTFKYHCTIHGAAAMSGQVIAK